MSEEKNKNSTVWTNEKSNSVKIVWIIVWIIAITWAWFAAYNFSPAVKDTISNIADTKSGDKYEKRINLAWKISVKDWEKTENIDINMKNLDIYLSKDMLKSRLMLDNLSIDTKEGKVEIKDADMLTIDTDNYGKIDFSLEDKNTSGKQSLADLLWWQETDMIKALSEWKYVHINEADGLIEMIPQVKKYPNAEKVLRSFFTNNPMVYLEKVWTIKDIKEKYLVSWSYEYLFVKDENNNLSFKAENCDILENEQQKAMCKNQVSMINMMTKWKISLKQENGIETIIYDDIADFSISYGNKEMISMILDIPWFVKSSFENDIFKLEIAPSTMITWWTDIKLTAECNTAKRLWTINASINSPMWNMSFDAKINKELKSIDSNINFPMIAKGEIKYYDKKWNLNIEITAIWWNLAWDIDLKKDSANLSYNIANVWDIFKIDYKSENLNIIMNNPADASQIEISGELSSKKIDLKWTAKSGEEKTNIAMKWNMSEKVFDLNINVSNESNFELNADFNWTIKDTNISLEKPKNAVKVEGQIKEAINTYMMMFQMMGWANPYANPANTPDTPMEDLNIDTENINQ